MSYLYDYIEKIRQGILYDKISTKIDNYRVLTAALDIVGDSEEAINSYLALPNELGRGINYIYIYGVINAMMNEIQAVKVIYKILLGKDLNIRDDDNLEIIRLLRNKIFAHPIDLNNGSVNGFGIIAGDMSTHSFIPYSFLERKIKNYDEYSEKSLYEKVKELADRNIGDNFLVIYIPELIENHHSSLKKILIEIVDYLKL